MGERTPYQKRAIPALESSISHWERLRDSTNPYQIEQPWGKYCGCCQEFYSLYNDEVSACSDCEECPVKLFTGAKDCRNTPYLEARREFWHNDVCTDARQGAVDLLNEILVSVVEGKTKPPRSWKPEFLVNGEWQENSRRFPTREEAWASANDTYQTWIEPDNYRASPSNDEPNYHRINSVDHYINDEGPSCVLEGCDCLGYRCPINWGDDT